MLTAGARAQMAALDDDREAAKAERTAERVADDLQRLAPGDIVWSKTLQRDCHPVVGVVVVVRYDTDSGADMTPEAVDVVEFIRDDITVEPCEMCGVVGVRRVQARIVRIPVDDIAELRPRTPTGMIGNSHRLGRAWIDRGNDKRGMQYYRWAGQLAAQAGEVV